MKSLRLPDPCTLKEAAQWLSRESTAEWTANTILSRFLEWDDSKTSRVLAPPTLFVVIGPGTELLDTEAQFLPVKISTQWMLAITVPVDRFIHDLLLAGEAIPPGLATLYPPYRRYRATAPIPRKAIRFPREWVEHLLPAFDGLIYELNQGLHPDLAVLIADQNASTDAPSTDNEGREAQETESAVDVKAGQPDWETLSPEQKKVTWDGMTPARRREKARELVKKHDGHRAHAGAEVCITRERIGQLIKEDKPKEAEAPLPVTPWTQLTELENPKRYKASR
jgi:hypothetical protein